MPSPSTVFKTGGLDIGRFMGPAVFFFAFLVYLLTLAPGVTFWDSGELTFSAMTLGITHPPGYPVYSMLGRAFSLLPMGSAAYRINLMSAFFASSTVYLLYRLVEKIGAGSSGASVIAASASLGFAFYLQFWSQAVIAKELVINAFMLMAVATMLFHYNKDKGAAFLYASAFFLGLGVANHQSMLFIMPVYAGYFFLTDGNYRKPRVMLLAVFFFLLAFSAVVYLPIRAAAGPALNIGNPRSIADFIWVMKWDMYYTLVKAVVSNIYSHVTLLRLAAGVLAAAVYALVIYLFRKDGFTLFMAFSALFSYSAIVALTLSAEGIEKMGLKGKFFIPAVLFAVPVLAKILLWLWEARPAAGVARAVATAVLVLALAAVPAWGLVTNYRDNDNSSNFFAYDFATNTLKSVRQDAVLFARGDNGVFPVWYLQGFERFRDDVTFIHIELITYNWFIADLQQRLYKKYGMTYAPPAKLEDLEANVSALSLGVERITPTYFDYSAAMFLKVRLETFRPQGLVHLLPSWNAVPLKNIWDRYVLRGAFDGSTNKAFAAEGILSIYAWEAVIWAQQAYGAGRPQEALEAYELSKELGMSDEMLDRWARGIKENIKEGQKR